MCLVSLAYISEPFRDPLIEQFHELGNVEIMGFTTPFLNSGFGGFGTFGLFPDVVLVCRFIGKLSYLKVFAAEGDVVVSGVGEGFFLEFPGLILFKCEKH